MFHSAAVIFQNLKENSFVAVEVFDINIAPLLKENLDNLFLTV